MLTIHYMPFCRKSNAHPRGEDHKQVNYHGVNAERFKNCCFNRLRFKYNLAIKKYRYQVLYDNCK